ncbi:MAG: heme ABC exporter ATP-binding protein CcmA [Pseudomonadota bacterium]
MVLAVDNLCVARGGVPVLSDVSFSLRAGRALILRGPNGAGKTTLLRTVAGLQPPVSGEIDMMPDQAAYAGHADGIKATLSVFENLDFWASVFGTSRIDAALRSFDLQGLRNRPANQLSAGQKRRLGLARLLVTGRTIWLLDEPTVSLDAASVSKFFQATQAHLRAGGAALIATHVALDLPQAQILNVAEFRAKPTDRYGASDEAFL